MIDEELQVLKEQIAELQDMVLRMVATIEVLQRKVIEQAMTLKKEG